MRIPHQNQSPKLRSSVDLSVSADPRPLERTSMTTSIASFDIPMISITNKPTNPITTPIIPNILYIKESSILYKPNAQNIEEEPITISIMTLTPIDNLNDSLVIPRHPDPRVKLGYFGINDRSEEVKSSVIYGKINGRIAHIMLNNDCSIYILSINFANADNISYFSCKPVPVELVIQHASQFTLNTQIKKLPIEIDNIIQSKISYILSLSNCNTIFGMPFLNDRKLAIYPEKNIIILDDIEFLLVKDHNKPPHISTISCNQGWQRAEPRIHPARLVVKFSDEQTTSEPSL